MPAWALAQTVKPLPATRTYLTAQVYQEGGELHLEHAAGTTVEPLGSWKVTGTPVGHLIGLVRPSATGTDLRIIDASGRQVGTGTVPPGRVGIVTDAGVVTLVETLHNPVRPHEIGFYALSGARLREVSEPQLQLVKWFVQSDGRMVTLNQGPAADDRAVIVYAADGSVLWRYDWKGNGFPDVAVTPDTKRLVLLQQDSIAGTAELTVLGADNKVLQSHQLPNLYQLITSDDSTRIAAIGQQVAVLVDAKTGKLLWRKDEDIDLALPGGLRIDPVAARLVIVAAKRDRQAGVSRLSLRSLDLGSGEAQRADLGEIPLDEAPKVLDVGMAPTGERRVQLHDRTVDVAPEH